MRSPNTRAACAKARGKVVGVSFCVFAKFMMILETRYTARKDETMPSDLQLPPGTVALVTGGSRGIGHAIAAALRASGATTITCARNPAPNDEHCLACDVRDMGQVHALIGAIVSRHGRLDIAVNNAGGSPETAAETASPRFSEAIIALNLLAPLYIAQAVNRVMQNQQSGGSIINIASISGTRPSPGTAAYGAAKAGLLNLTQSLAMEWGPKVRVNAIVAGLIETEAAADHYGGAEGIRRVGATVPLQRMGTPQDIANAVLFLASPRSAYISGAHLAVHGGGEWPSFLSAARQRI
jgi:NAD(P)-dependent dehydrogenase (short-subunit alcohol dehydrogenase family)